MPLGYDRLESFDHDELTAKHCYFRCSRPPDVDGIKFFYKRWPGRKTLRYKTVFCSLVIFINFDPINIRSPWAPAITMFCSEFIMIKTFKPIITRRHWLPIWFYIFFNKACLVLGHPFLHLGCFWLDFTSFFDPSG